MACPFVLFALLYLLKVNGSFLAVGGGGSGPCIVASAGEDAASTWSVIPGSNIFNPANGVAYSDVFDSFLVVGNPVTTFSAALFFSNGTLSPSAPFPGGIGQCAAYGNGTWIVGGSEKFPTTIMFSTSGLVWMTPSSNAQYLNITWGLVFARNIWLAVGKDQISSRSCCMTSIDNGSSWTPRVFASLTEAFAVAYSIVQDRFVAVGFGGAGSGAQINVSPDGVVWTSSGSSSIALFNNGGVSVVYATSLNRWFVGGAASMPQNIAYSDDGGLSWTRFLVNMGSAVQGLAYSDLTKQVVAVGSGSGSQIEFTSNLLFLDSSPQNPLGTGNMFAVAVNSSSALRSSTNFCPVATCVCALSGGQSTCFASQGAASLLNVSVPSASLLQFNGGANFSSGSMVSTTVTSSIVVIGSASLSGSLVIATSAQIGSMTTTVILNATGSVNGQFQVVSAVSTNGLCAIATPSYGANSVSVIISVTQTCSSSGGLSPGAIAGIAIGSACFMVLVVPLCVLIVRAGVAKKDKKANAALQKEGLAALRE